jgi:mono/diheme cytochrome c family protein
MKKTIFLLIAATGMLTGCYYDKYNDMYPTVRLQGCDTANVTYSRQINKTMTSYCIGCHNASTASGGVVLDNYQGVQTEAANGRLMGGVKHQSGYKPMPPTGQLDDCRLKMLEKWIAAGTPNN